MQFTSDPINTHENLISKNKVENFSIYFIILLALLVFFRINRNLLILKIMLEELNNIELIKIEGGCQDCFEAGQRWRRAIELGCLILLFI
jgi:hypothetical protein